jgi:hypothetical protein
VTPTLRRVRQACFAAAVVVLLGAATSSPPLLPSGDWHTNCDNEPYGYAQTTSSNGVISRRFEVRAGDQAPGDKKYHDGRQRCEQKLRDVFYPMNTDVWLAYDFRWTGEVPPATSNSHEIMNQFQQEPEACDDVGHPPTLSLRYERGQFQIGSHATTEACDTIQPPNVNIYAEPWFPADSWQRIILRTRFDPTGTDSRVTLWINGQQKFDATGIPLGYALDTIDPTKAPHFSHGIYRDGQPETTVFEFANLEVGTVDLSARLCNPPPLPDDSAPAQEGK